MLFVKILLILSAIILLIYIIKLRPKFDLVLSRNKYILLLWYTKKYDGYEKRKYVKLLEV